MSTTIAPLLWCFGQGFLFPWLVPRKARHRSPLLWDPHTLTETQITYSRREAGRGCAETPFVWISSPTPSGTFSFVDVVQLLSHVLNSLQLRGLQHTRLPWLHYLPELAQTHVHWIVMPSNSLILCHPPLLLPSVIPSSRAFSNKSALHIRWVKL